MAQQYPNLPDDDHIVRVVSWTKVQKDSDDNPIGITLEAFRLGDNEEGLSVNWLERASDVPSERLLETLRLLRTTRSVGKKARLAVLEAGATRQFARARNRKIRIIHAPEIGNEPHSEIRQFPRDDDILLDILASEGVLEDHECGPLIEKLEKMSGSPAGDPGTI